ncbi:MAG: phosphoenolpyruvate--protein phosphotransferase [Proteobacteria bacterium]|nr:phosphoenolpyruvate--protein phosphotransferase [Pseudomonadota bacterium]
MRRLRGIAGAEGFAVGEAFLIDRRRLRVSQRKLPSDNIETEIQRFHAAVEATDDELQRIGARLAAVGGDTLILEAHRLIVRDKHLIERTTALIRQKRVNAEWALREVAREIRKVFEQVDERYFRERRSDVDFGVRHLLVTLIGERPTTAPVPARAIVVAHDLAPAEIAQLHRAEVQGFVTEVGGPTSHSAIMARALGMVAVIGVRRATTQIANAETVVVDGKHGEVLVAPDSAMAEDYRRLQRERTERLRELLGARTLPAVTLDGVRVTLLANAGSPEDVSLARDQGAEGIGLYRSDYLPQGAAEDEGEQEHLRRARQVLVSCGGLPVTFRTCDLEVRPGALGLGAVEANPAMGLRGIRLSLLQPEVFAAELRGLLRAAAGQTLRVMFPMVSSVSELREAKSLLFRCRDALVGACPSSIEVGIMVEMPSAALIADQLARESDFFAIGTNDLIQYTLGVDRVNDRVNHLFRPLHPAILRLIARVVQAARSAGIGVSVCGEMAGDPLLSLLLMGLGVRAFSINPRALPRVKAVIRSGRCSDGERMAQRALGLSTAEEIEEEVRAGMAEMFPEETFAGATAGASADEPWPR